MDFRAERVVDRLQNAVVSLLVEVPPRAALRREVDWLIPPLVARTEAVEAVAGVGLTGPVVGKDGDVGLTRAQWLR